MELPRNRLQEGLIMIDEELTEAIAELEDRIRMLKDTVQRLNGKLHALATPTLTLPEEPGWYLTQQRMPLRKDNHGDWVAFNPSGNALHYFWPTMFPSAFTQDSGVIYKALGPDAFPLVPISEVILPSEHIEEED